MKKIAQFLVDRSRAMAIQYAMTAALVSVAIIADAASLGSAMNAKF